jgi:glycerol kinase
MTKTVLGLDAGTTGVTAVLFAPDGEGRLNPVARAYREFPQHFPEPGWVEHRAEEILAATDEVLEEILENPLASQVACLGIANQRETVFALDPKRPSRALAPGIVWQDRRTASRCEQLAKQPGVPALVSAKTGLVLDPYFSATKIEWLLGDQGPRSVESGSALFGTVDTLLIAHLTGDAVFATDATNASRTMLFDIDKKCWDPELCAVFGVEANALPKVLPSCGDFGVTSRQVVGRSIPILGVAGDQQAALFGQGGVRPGDLKCTFGTGTFLLLNGGLQRSKVSTSGLLTTLAVGPDGQPCYALEGSVFMGGAIIQWMRDELGILESAAQSEVLAASVADTGGVVLVPAFTGLGAPYWDAGARAGLFGLSRGSGRGHIARAGLEAIAMQNVELIELLRQETALAIDTMRVDGGAVENDLLMQLQADFAGLQVLRPSFFDATALGAASLAAMALGLVESAKGAPIGHVFEPDLGFDRDSQLARWRAAVARVRT